MKFPRGLYEVAYDVLNNLQKEGPLNLTAIYRKTPTDKHTRKLIEILLRNGCIIEKTRSESFEKTSTKLHVESSQKKVERPLKKYERVFKITDKGVMTLNKLEDLKKILE